MTLVEEYYELNEAEEVPAVWKILQIGFYGTSAGLGLWCGFTMATLRLKFGDRCYLFTTQTDYSKNLTAVSDLLWESDTVCDYYQFSFVSSFIVGIIWAALFLMCGKGGRSLTGLPQPWRIIWPSLIFNLIYFLAILGTSVKIQEGTHNFCKQNEKGPIDICIPLSMLIKKEDLEMTAFQINIVPKTAWGCTISWLALFLLSLFRIIFLVDFRMYKICVFKIDDTIQNRKEEVLKVTNYEEPKRMNFSRELLNARQNFEAEDTKKLEPRQMAERGGLNRKIKSLNPGFQPNAAFYIMADKMLGKHRKPKMSARAGDDAFARNLPLDSMKLAGNQSKSNEFDDHVFFSEYEDDEDISSSSTNQKISFKEDFDTSGSENEILVRNFDQNDSEIFKKLI